MTLTEFLLARIAEDEAVARAAMNVPVGVERTASVPQRANAGWRGYNPDGTEMLVHAPVSDAPGAPVDELGRWGWHGGPVEADSDPESPVVKAFGPLLAEPDRPFRVGDSGLWDESEPIGAEYFRATVPASAGQGTAQHIARHNPARVLAECEAKRRIVKEVEASRTALSALPGGSGRLAVKYGLDAIECQLALPYAGYPDYRDEWKP